MMTVSTSVDSWLHEYRRKVTTAEAAVRDIKSGDSLYIQSNAAAPVILTEKLTERAHELKDVHIYHILTLGKADYTKPEYGDSFRVHALFIGGNIRSAVNEGRADYTPVFLGEIPSLFMSGQLDVDVCLLQVSPPDRHGYCSYGVSVDCTIAARKRARLVIAEVNKQMPRTFGRSFLHVSKIDRIVETDHPLPVLEVEPSDDVADAIGRHVASLVEDGATLQMGIGQIPDSVLRYLHDKKDLGVHSEMISDGIVDLVNEGVVTNDQKTVYPGQIVVSFAMGTKKLYDFLDNNPMVQFHPSDITNDPVIISQNHKMTAINSALQVDLTGQVSADSIGTLLYSGFGGQVDFIRGAARCKNGRPIIALPSTAKNGTVSRIVAFLAEGSGVVTSRADVHYVVTEYGIAQLHGKNLNDRARALIAIAHPEHREKLEEQLARFPWAR